MGKADLHIHTVYSHDGTASVEEVLDEAAYRADLDVIAVTDHNEIRGALEAAELAVGYGLECIPGIEISTAEGHLLALFVEQNIPAYQPLIETLIKVGELGGICIAAHPLAGAASSLSAASLWSAMTHPEASQVLVGLETHNGSPFFRDKIQTRFLAAQLGLAEVGSSDSHVGWTIGCTQTTFEGKSALDFRKTLTEHRTRPEVVFKAGSLRVTTSWIQGRINLGKSLHPRHQPGASSLGMN